MGSVLALTGSVLAVTTTAGPAFACHGLLYANPVRQAAGFTFEVTSSFPSASNIVAQTNQGSVSLSATSWQTNNPPVVATVTGLTAGQSANVSFTADLSNGGTACSSYSNSALLAAAVAPTLSAATPTADGFTVTVTDFNAARYDYVVSSDSGTAAIDGNGLVTVTGLAPGAGATLTVQVNAKNGSGFSGSASATRAGAAVDPAPAPPSAPNAPVAVAGDSSVKVTWAAPASNGSTITGYTVTAAPGGATCTTTAPTTTCLIGGLDNGASYTFRVRAASDQGQSPLSAASNAVTPVAVRGKDLVLDRESVPPGGQVEIVARGYAPGSEVDFYLLSTPHYLGAATADARGVAVLLAALPPGYLGQHTVRALGIGRNGRPLSQDTALLIAAARDGLPVTGSGLPAALAGAAGVLIAGGAGLLVAVRRRRRAAAA